MKRDKALLFQCLISVVLVALAGLAGLGLFASARLSQQSKMGPLEVSRNLASPDHAEWNQFYDAVNGWRFVEPGRKQEAAKPADAAQDRAANDIVNVPTASANQAPASPNNASTATTTSPVTPHSASNELAGKTDAPPVQTTVLPEHPSEKSDSAVVPNEPSRALESRRTTPSVAASESAPPAVANPPATAPIPTPDANAAKSRQRIMPPAASSKSTPRAKVAAPMPSVRSAARVKEAAPEPEREPARSRPSMPSRARVALPRQLYAPESDGPRWNGTQWVDPQHIGPPQHRSGALSYAPSQYNAQPPDGPQFGPYFPYGSSPPSTQRSRTQQSRSPQRLDAPSYDSRQFAPPPQMAPTQPAQSFNNPYAWR